MKSVCKYLSTVDPNMSVSITSGEGDFFFLDSFLDGCCKHHLLSRTKAKATVLSGGDASTGFGSAHP